MHWASNRLRKTNSVRKTSMVCPTGTRENTPAGCSKKPSSKSVASESLRGAASGVRCEDLNDAGGLFEHPA